MKRPAKRSSKSASFDIHPDALPLLALIVSAVALAGIFVIWTQLLEMRHTMAALKMQSYQGSQRTEEMGLQIKQLVSVKPTNEPINFAVDTLAVTVTKNVTTAEFRADQLKNLSEACNIRRPDGYFNRVADGLNGAKQAVYAFRYDKTALYAGGRAILIQNALKYKDVNAVRADFASCSGAPLPMAVNKDWILFLAPCMPSDIPEQREASQRACQEIRQALATVKLR